DVKVDLETRVVRARNVVRRRLLETLGGREPAPEGLEGQRAIEARLAREGKGLAEGGQVDGHDDLVGELGETACAQRTQVRDRLAERLEDGQGRVEIGLLPPDHDSTRRVDGAPLSSRDGP